MKKVKLINLTPHNINLKVNGETIVIEPAVSKSELPRLKETIKKLEDIEVNGYKVPITVKEFEEAYNIPEPKEGVYYIVSALIAKALKREDFIVPNTVRDESGNIVGCDGFSKILK